MKIGMYLSCGHLNCVLIIFDQKLYMLKNIYPKEINWMELWMFSLQAKKNSDKSIVNYRKRKRWALQLFE